MKTKAIEQRVSVRVPDDVMGWMRKAASKRRVSMSIIVREALLDHYEKRHSK